MTTATTLPIPHQTPPRARQQTAPRSPAPRYEGLFLEPAYLDGTPYQHDEDTEAAASE